MDYLITYCSLNYTYDFFQKNHPVITTVVKKKKKKKHSLSTLCRSCVTFIYIIEHFIIIVY